MRGSPFFDGVSQVDVRFAGCDAKLPIFYYENRAMTAIFPARLSALRRMLPDRRFVPARLAPGVGLIGLTCFDYLDTDIGPYGEVAVSIVLKPPALPNVPALGVLASLRSEQLHVYVHHLPVTTEPALVGGRTFWNYPKFIGEIEFSDRGEAWSCRLAEGREHIFTVTGKRTTRPREKYLQFFSSVYQDGQPQVGEVKVHALEFGESRARDAASVELGDRHPIARELAGALLSTRALVFQHMPRFEAILYGPEHVTINVLKRLQDAIQAHERHGLEIGAGRDG